MPTMPTWISFSKRRAAPPDSVKIDVPLPNRLEFYENWLNAEGLRMDEAMHPLTILVVGQTLTIPPVDGVVVSVAEGDTLDSIAAQNGKSDLNYKTSIVDLMKVLGMDSSLENRKELATELGYTGAKDGSAEMNIWLHKEVMRQLAANGGKVPANLTD